jgi:hypothetical protein
MDNLRTKRILAMATALLCAAAPVFAGIGLMTRFADVVLENLKPGSYNLRVLKNLPYVVTNPGDLRIDVVVEILAPNSLMDGYEPIPDPNWIQILPNRFTLDPAQNHFSDIVLNIPDDPAYVGRHFQATIWAHTAGVGMVAAGMNSRLRFSIGTMGPDALQREKKKKAMLTLDFDLKPETLNVIDATVGGEFNLKTERRQSLKLTNRADDPLKVKLTSIKWDDSFTRPAGYEAAPDPAWLKLKPEVQTIKPLTIGEFVPTLKIPKDPALKGKKFVFLVKAEVVAEKVTPVEVYSRVLVTVSDK